MGAEGEKGADRYVASVVVGDGGVQSGGLTDGERSLVVGAGRCDRFEGRWRA